MSHAKEMSSLVHWQRLQAADLIDEGAFALLLQRCKLALLTLWLFLVHGASFRGFLERPGLAPGQSLVCF